MSGPIGAVGLGAGTLGNLYKSVSDADARATVEAAWTAGIRHFDTAPFYGFGLSERRLGDALRELPRDEYFLSTKVGRILQPIKSASPRFGFQSPMPFEPVFDYSYDGVMRSFEDSLQRMGLSRIDCIYMHDIGAFTHGDDHNMRLREAEGGLRAMLDLRAQSVVKQVGLGVNETEICDIVMANFEIDRILLAGRYTLLNHAPLDGFFERCLKNGTNITAAGVFNSGILATGANTSVKPYYDYKEAPKSVIAKVAQIEEVCSKYGIPLSVAAMLFPLAHSAVDSILLGMSGTLRVQKNMALLNMSVPPDLWTELKTSGLIPADAPTQHD